MAANPDPAPELELVHLAARRIRLRHAGDPGDAQDLADRLASAAGVTRAAVRPATGSVILRTAEDAGTVLAALEAAGTVRLRRPPPPLPLEEELRAGAARLDAGLRAATGEALDLRALLILVLLFGAVVQALRGRLAGPALTLLMAALALIELPRQASAAAADTSSHGGDRSSRPM